MGRFAEWFDRRVTRLGLSTEEIAHEVERHPSAVRHWRGGLQSPSPECVPPLGALLRADPLTIADLIVELEFTGFGRLMRVYRYALGLTQKDAAARMGLSGGEEWSRWERGSRSITPDKREQIAQAVNIPTEVANGVKRSGNPNFILPAINPKKGGCTGCELLPICRNLDGLPILCEPITPDQILAAFLHGYLPELLSRYDKEQIEDIADEILEILEPYL